ncbi:MAG: signal peptide peptidase SppA [Desulfatirhabdiaceae bacterium]
MFSRRHPYLFFLLIFSTICASVFLTVTLLVAIVLNQTGLTEFDTADNDKIGVIEVTGYIMESTDILKNIKTFRKDASVRAIVVRVDSPGGSVGPSQEIYRELQKTLPVKPVIASMGALAASGGYYIAAGARGIVANPGTITGSIGVIMSFTNLEEILKKIGLAPVVIKSGTFKDTGSPMRQMTDADRELLQNFSDQIHRQFIDAIAAGRNMEIDKIRSVADGRILSGETALELGLVDRLGNLEDAIDWAAETAGISGDFEVVRPEEKKLEWLKKFAETAVESIISRISVQHLVAG